MTYDPHRDSGMAERKHFVHLLSGDFAAIVQGSEAEAEGDRNYAKLVYVANSPVTTKSTYMPIAFGDSPSIDAFGRARVSDQLTLFDSKQLYTKQPLFWDEVLSGSATSTHSVSGACTTMSVFASGDMVIRQTFQRMNYQPGKSQLVFETGVLGSEAVSGANCKIGYFSSATTGDYSTNYDGLWFECDGSAVYAKGSRTGEETISVAQSDWNIDPMDGTGDSGITLDWSKAQIFAFDFEWLGVGRVRYGVVINGLLYYVHQNTVANNGTQVYMSSPNQPLRYEIRSTGGAKSLVHICASVASEGGQTQSGFLRSVATSGTVSIGSGATEALLGIRLKPDRLGGNVTPLKLEILNESSATGRWFLCLNPTLGGTAPSWKPLQNGSIQYADANDSGDNITVLNAGTIVDQGFVRAQTTGVASVPIDTFLRLGSKINGNPNELWICMEDFGAGGDNFRASITIRDQS